MHNQLTRGDIKKMEEEIEYRKLIVRKKVIEDTSGEDEVGLYNTVELYFEDDDEVETFRIVTTVRGDTLNGSVSIESPIGRAVFGKKKGDRVYVKINETSGYYVVIQNIVKTHDDGTDKLRSF